MGTRRILSAYCCMLFIIILINQKCIYSQTVSEKNDEDDEEEMEKENFEKLLNFSNIDVTYEVTEIESLSDLKNWLQQFEGQADSVQMLAYDEQGEPMDIDELKRILSDFEFQPKKPSNNHAVEIDGDFECQGDLVVKGNLKVGGTITVLGNSKSQQTVQPTSKQTSVLNDIFLKKKESIQSQQSDTKLSSNNGDVASATNANKASDEMGDGAVPSNQKTEASTLDQLQFGILDQLAYPRVQGNQRQAVEEHTQSQRPSHRTRNFIIHEPNHQSSAKPFASCTTLTEFCHQCSSASATCLSNEVRTGGGCNVTPSKFHLSGNYPDKDNLSWKCVVHESQQVELLEAFVICCR